MAKRKVYDSELVTVTPGNGVGVDALKEAGLDGTIQAAPVYKNADGNYRTEGRLPDGYSWVNYAGQANDPAYVEQTRGSWGNADNAWTSDEDWNAIQSYKQQYEQAKAAGDTAGMDAAHAAAEKLRAQYGYSGGADGSAYLPTMAYTGAYSRDEEDGGGYGSGGYLSKYQARIDALADAILNRDPFSYDKEKDPLYLQYKDTYTRGGQRGMQDTLAQVSARTGGLASSYAESAAQQTYNNYMAQLADKVPELYQLAYSMYMDELGQDRNDLSMLMGLDDTAYGRWSDDRNFGYNAYRDSVSDSQWQQIPYIDAWGRTESSGKVGTRVVNNMLNPSYTSTIVEGEMEEELLRLYMQTDESVFPSRAAKYFNVDGERKDLTAEEYVKYATLKGQTSYEVVSELLKSKAYKGMNDEKKAKAVEDSYTLANQLAKSKISDYAPDSWVVKAMEAKKSYNIPYSTFVAVRAELSDLESLKDADGDTITDSLGLLKMEAIYNMKGLTDKQRQALFQYMGVGKNVIHYNPALVKQKLAVMRKKAQ